MKEAGIGSKDIIVCTGKGIKDGFVLGGTGLISDAAVRKIFSMGANDPIITK